MQTFRVLSRTALAQRTFSTTASRPLAKMQLIGRLADSPEVTPTSTGQEVTRYSLGVSQGPKDESGNRSVSWFKVASFLPDGPQRDLLLNLPKGSLIYVEAEAKMDSFEVEGQKRSALNLRARNFEVLSRPRNEQSGETDPVQNPQSGLGSS